MWLVFQKRCVRWAQWQYLLNHKVYNFCPIYALHEVLWEMHYHANFFFIYLCQQVEFSEKYLEIPGKYLENESRLWLATLCKLSLNSFISQTLKEFQLKCEACDLYSYTEMLKNTDMLAFCFWLNCISSLF